MKNNQELAAQAALRAQQIMFRKSIGSTASASISNNNNNAKSRNAPQPFQAQTAPCPSKKSTPPVVPARGDSALSKPPPEIPPKRHMAPPVERDASAKQSSVPPPLPQKPSMVRRNNANSAGASIPGSPIPPMKNVTANAPVATPPNISHNPFLNHSPQMGRNSLGNWPHTDHKLPAPVKKPVSPIEDFSSEDALRGIESGLRNMERAMQEQINMRSAQQQQQKPTEKISFNRGFSMDQMRLDAMNLGGMRSTLEEMKSKGFIDMNATTAPNASIAPNTRPIENHMKSLDRNLPLELQYSRHHHHRSQSQQEMVEQMRHNLTSSAKNAATAMISNARQSGVAISREDVRLRRRSSHDENQMSHSQPNSAGKMKNKLLLPVEFYFSFNLLFALSVISGLLRLVHWMNLNLFSLCCFS